VPICGLASASAVAQASASWMPPVSKSAITVGLTSTRCSKTWQHGAKPPSIGSLATLREGFAHQLHLMVNDPRELFNFTLTPGNTDDRTPVPKLLQQLFGKVFADKGYVSQKLANQLTGTTGVQKFPGIMSSSISLALISAS
jgi:hypothetical protein